MLEIQPGVLGGIPRTWRLRVVDGQVRLEGSPDEGCLWVPYLAIETAKTNTVVPFKFVGPMAEADDKVDTEALGAVLARVNPGRKPRFARCLECGSTTTPAESMYCTSCKGQLTEDPVTETSD